MILPFSSKKTEVEKGSPYLEKIGVDLHLHVLPGIDDGSPSMEESLQILAAHHRAGIRRIVATPHIRAGMFPNDQYTIHAAWGKLIQSAASRWPDLTITYAAEHFGDDHLMMLLEKGRILPLFDRYVLVETSMRAEEPHFTQVLQAMIDRNWQPVLAHPERYRPWQHRPERYAELREMGVIFQVNLLSLGGQYGPAEQNLAAQMIRQGWIGAVGTDLHRASQYGYLERAARTPEFELLFDLPLLNYLVPAHETRNG
jgi:tyrosine-protein phosphatase YwqE